MQEWDGILGWLRLCNTSRHAKSCKVPHPWLEQLAIPTEIVQNPVWLGALQRVICASGLASPIRVDWPHMILTAPLSASRICSQAFRVSKKPRPQKQLWSNLLPLFNHRLNSSIQSSGHTGKIKTSQNVNPLIAKYWQCYRWVKKLEALEWVQETAHQPGK